MTGPSEHLTFGGSTAHRWLRCAGSTQLSATLPPQPENEHMAAGTRAHALLELAARERRVSVLDFEGERLQPHWPAFTPGDVEAVQVAVDDVNAVLDQHPDAVLLVEQQFKLPPHDDVGGTVDIMIYLPSLKRLLVKDYKHGVGHFVEADGNPQLKLYATGALLATEFEVESVHATIIQPRCPVGEPIRTAVYSVAELIAFSDEVDEAVAAAKSPAPTFTPGAAQCHWCRAAHVCPALARSATALVAVPENAGPQLPLGDALVLRLPPAGELRDPRVLAEVKRAADLMRTWLDAIDDAAFAAVISGQALPGFKVVAKRPSRRYIDEATTLNWAVDDMLLPMDDVAPRKLRSVAQLEKLVKSAHGAAGVKELAAGVTKVSSGVKLVPEDAKGDAVDPLQLAASDFAASVTDEK